MKKIMLGLLFSTAIITSYQSANHVHAETRQEIRQGNVHQNIIKYNVQYVEKSSNKPISKPITKISFPGETETEKAEDFEEYKLVSEPVITKKLSSNDNSYIFYYEKIDVSKLKRTQEETIKKVNYLTRISNFDREEIIGKIKKSKDDTTINNLYNEAVELDNKAVSQIRYEIRYIDKNTGQEIAPRVHKLDFAGTTIQEKDAKDIEGYVKPSNEEIKPLLLTTQKKNVVELYYYKSIENIPLSAFVKQRATIKGMRYQNTNFTNNPEGLTEYLIKAAYTRSQGITFYATDKEVRHLYSSVFDKSTKYSLVRLVKNWTPESSAEDEPHPELGEGVKKYTIALTYQANFSQKDMEEAELEIERIIKEYKIDEMKTDFEKVKFVYDYMVQKYEMTPNTKNRTHNGRNVHTYAGVLLSKGGVCEGWSQLFNRFMERLGVDSYLVVGATYEPWQIEHPTLKSIIDNWHRTKYRDVWSMTHGWNMVKLDNKWYYLDVYHGKFWANASSLDKDGNFSKEKALKLKAVFNSGAYDKTFLRGKEWAEKTKVFNEKFIPFDEVSPEDYKPKIFNFKWLDEE